MHPVRQSLVGDGNCEQTGPGATVKQNIDYIYVYEKNASSLIPLLQKTQENYGYLPDNVMERIAEYVDVPLSRVYGVATFYSQFRFRPLGTYVIKICHGTACHVNGGVNIARVIKEDVGIEEGETTSDGLISLERVACLGCCSLAPVIMINDTAYGNLTPAKVRRLIHKVKTGEMHD